MINGSLEAISANPMKFSESQLILKPFPQFESGKKKLPELWEEYRQKMISLSGISIFLFGNKRDGDAIVEANGLIREFEISRDLGNICIPVGCTGYATESILKLILAKPTDYYENSDVVVPLLETLLDSDKPLSEKVDVVIAIINEVIQ